MFKIYAHSSEGRILSLADGDLANAVEHLEVAKAGDVMRVTAERTEAWLLDYDTETYSLVPIAKFRVFHPHGGVEWIEK